MSGRRGARPALVAGAVVAVLVVVIVASLAGRSGRRGGVAFDPRSTAPDGLRAVVLLLEQFGVSVEVRSAPPADERTIVWRLPGGGANPIDDSRAEGADGKSIDGGGTGADALDAWVEAGGTLVDLDPFARSAPEVVDVFPTDDPLSRGTCSAATAPTSLDLDGVDEVTGLAFGFDPADAPSCLDGGTTGSGVGLVVRPRGRGRVLSVAGAEPFTNGLLAEADNSVLAIRLARLVPAQPSTPVRTRDVGASGVVLLRADVVGTGERTLWQLVPDTVWLMFWQLGLAFVVLVVALGRRLGEPVDEPRLRHLPATATSDAVGDLLHRGRQHDLAASWLRRRACRETRASLRFVRRPQNHEAPHDLEPDDREAVPVDSDHDLVALAAAVDARRLPAGAVRGTGPRSAAPDDEGPRP